MARKIKKRVDRELTSEEQEALKLEVPSDKFTRSSMTAAQWVEENKGVVVIGLIVLVVGIIVGFVVLQVREGQQLEASDHASQAIWAYIHPSKSYIGYQQLSEAEDYQILVPVHETEKERWDAVYQKSKEGAAQASGVVANVPLLAQAAAANRAGEFEEAIELYNRWLANQNSDLLRFGALQGLARAYTGAGKYDEAMETFEKVVAAQPRLASTIAYEKARLLEKAGKIDEARELYHGILEDEPQTPWKNDIERRLAQLKTSG